MKQASRNWNKRLTDFLKKYNLKSANSDPCIFTNENKSDFLIVAFHIEDGLIAAKSEDKVIELLENFKSEFEVTTSELDKFLGFQIQKLVNGNILFIKRTIQKNCSQDSTWRMPIQSLFQQINTQI